MADLSKSGGTDRAGEDGGRKQTATWIFGAVFLIAAGLRIAYALRKSLVLDEFHSYYHATRDTLGSFFSNLILDNHPPLSFAVISGSRMAFGEGEFALRLPALIYGLLELLLLVQIAKRIGLRRGRIFAVALLAFSSLHLDFSTQVRMYALHALAVTGLVEALLTLVNAPKGQANGWARVRVALWLTVGLLNHYFFIQYIFWIAVTGLIAMRGQWIRFKPLVLPSILAVTICTPWYIRGFLEQLAHQLPPGGANVGLMSLAEAFIHMFYLNIRIGGPFLRIVFIASGAIATLGAVLGLLRLYLHNSSAPDRFTPVLLGTVAFLVPLATTITASLFARAGFTWHYVLPSAAAIALLAANFANEYRIGRVVVGLVCSSALLLSVLNALSTGTEDYRAAVQMVVERSQPGDGVISVEWQPPLFPQGQPWRYYLRTTSEESGQVPELLDMNSGFNLANPQDIRQYERIWVLSSYLPSKANLLRTLRAEFDETKVATFGFQPTLLLFTRR